MYIKIKYLKPSHAKYYYYLHKEIASKMVLLFGSALLILFAYLYKNMHIFSIVQSIKPTMFTTRPKAASSNKLLACPLLIFSWQSKPIDFSLSKRVCSIEQLYNKL